MDDSARAAAMTELQSLLLTTPGVDDFVDGVARAAARHVGAASSATITLRRDKRPTLVAASDPHAAVCDEVEYAAADGPCLTAIDVGQHRARPGRRAGDAVAGVALGGARARVRVGRRAAPRGAARRADRAQPLRGRAHTPGTTPRWRWRTCTPTRSPGRSTLFLRSADQAEMNADLRAALVSRAVIDQAIGVIMAENRCTAQDAMAILRSAAQHRKVKLREVAASIVEGVTGSPPRNLGTFRQRV